MLKYYNLTTGTVVTALQYEGNNRKELLSFCKDNLVLSKKGEILPEIQSCVWFKTKTKKGDVIINKGDWIINKNGKFIPCHDEEFTSNYSNEGIPDV